MSATKQQLAGERAGERTTRALSADGTPICYWTSGHGQPLLLVHGTTADHTRWRPLLPFLEPYVTVHALDRRGRGGSGDAPEYEVEREFEDVVAVVDRIAQESGAPVDVLAHSFGGVCALGAALQTGSVRRLVLYEPPLRGARAAQPPGLIERLDAMLAAGDRERVVETFIREVVRMPEEEFAAYRALPAWPARVAAAHTISRELAVDPVAALDLDRVAVLRTPTLLLSGGESPEWMRADTDTVAAALPDARIAILEGQQHIAIDRVPERFARKVRDFVCVGPEHDETVPGGLARPATPAPTTGAAHALEPTDGPLLREELQLAFRNRGMPLEAMRHDLTPTGLHYLVAHWDIPPADPASWRLTVDGRVHRPLQLTLEEIRARPRRTLPVTLECAGNGRGWLAPRPVSLPWLGEAIGTAEWTGTPLRDLLREAGLDAGAVEIVFRGADRGIQGDEEQSYARSLPLAEAARPEVLLAYEMNGRPLEPQHGFPLRLIVPGWYGMTSVKWLTAIEAVTEPFEGFQQAVAYRYQQDADDPGQPVSRARVRALMIPPGIPDFFSRRRFVAPGLITLWGRAWSGHGSVERVEVGVDGQWADATLAPPLGEYAWRRWSFDWAATAGEHELECRATDTAGNAQPQDPPWNYQGMGNNVVQRIPVVVR